MWDLYKEKVPMVRDDDGSGNYKKLPPQRAYVVQNTALNGLCNLSHLCYA